MPEFIKETPGFKLNTGASIPSVGLGTWRSGQGEVAEAVKHALQNGYRHLDCAWAYGNEKEVGEGIKASGVPRSEIFITGKLWCTRHQNVEKGLDETLADLGTDYVDLFLIHWPVCLNDKGNDPKFPTLPDGSRDIDFNWNVEKDTWKGMEAVYKKGKAKAIGVSNFSIPKLKKLLETAEVVPAANQVELHPYLPQDDIVDFCKSKGILMEAYSPLGSNDSPILKDEEVLKIASKHGVESGTILISYQVARNVVVLPKSVTPARIEKNLKLVALDKEDMDTLNGLQKTKGKRFLTPAWKGVKLGFADWD